jgi:hypothetical protein
MASVAIRDIYLEALRPFGDVEDEVEAALRRHTIERISEKIAELRSEDRRWADKYARSYQEFAERTSNDPDFVEELHRRYPEWELDQAHWQFSHEGAREWAEELQRILMS